MGHIDPELEPEGDPAEGENPYFKRLGGLKQDLTDTDHQEGGIGSGPKPAQPEHDRYKQLRDEALGRVPAHTPEWTNPNAGDPGQPLTERATGAGERLGGLLGRRLVWLALIGAAIIVGLGVALLPGRLALLDPCSPANQTATAEGEAPRRLAITSFYVDEKGVIELDPCATPLSGASKMGMPDLDDPTRAPSASPSGGVTVAPSSGCACSGVDYVCASDDGSTRVSYNAPECGGSGDCECREPNKTLVCPDGTYADFNPQCMAGAPGGGCVCVCDQYDANQKCLVGHDSCDPQKTCLP